MEPSLYRMSTDVALRLSFASKDSPPHQRRGLGLVSFSTTLVLLPPRLRVTGRHRGDASRHLLSRGGSVAQPSQRGVGRLLARGEALGAQSASGFGLVHVLVPVGAAVPHRGAQSRHRSPQPASTPREGMRAMPRHAVAVAVRRLARRLALGVRASQHAARRRVCPRVVGRYDTTFCVRSWLRRAKRNGVHILTRMQFALFPKRRRHFIRKVGPPGPRTAPARVRIARPDILSSSVRD